MVTLSSWVHITLHSVRVATVPCEVVRSMMLVLDSLNPNRDIKDSVKTKLICKWQQVAVKTYLLPSVCCPVTFLLALLLSILQCGRVSVAEKMNVRHEGGLGSVEIRSMMRESSTK